MPQSQPKPFMREKTMWIVIVLLALALLLVIFTQIEHGRRFRSLRRGMFYKMGQVVSPPQTLPKPSAVFVSDSGRMALGPLVSPDKEWLMQMIEIGTPETTIEHRLLLKGLKHPQSRVLVTQSEKAKELTPDRPGTHRWHAAGWSKDGKNVYLVSEEVFVDGTDAVPGKSYGRELIEVNLQSGSMKSVLVLPPGDSLFGHGFMDISAQQNQALFLSSDRILLTDLRGVSKRVLPLKRQEIHDEWRSLLLHPSGTHLAVVYARYPKGALSLGQQPVERRVGLFNLKTNKYQDLGTVSGSSVAWRDVKTLVVIGENGQTKQFSIQLP